MERMVEVAGMYRIGFVVWETTRIPRSKLRVLQTLDELWVPSAWGRAILMANGLSPERVHVVPEGVDPETFRPSEPGARDSASPFRFLCVGKWENRKGIADLARAYSREFEASEPVELILHCFNPYLPGFSISAALRELDLPPHAPIRTSNPGSRASLVALYGGCDVFVLPTKAEGWGLTIIEAMSCGVPAIATDYSAHTDFLHHDNGYLVAVAGMVPVHDPYFYRADGDLGVWAQPDTEHLQQLMRLAYREGAERRQKGERARQEVISHWTWRQAAQKAHRRLQAL
jgi:glycosyltransferase involved in cell wall biosynthesis